MGNIDDLRRFYYHSENQEADAISRQTDELMIANMISILNNPNLWQILTEDEKQTVLSVIRNHVVLKAKLTKGIQEDFIHRLEDKGMGL